MSILQMSWQTPEWIDNSKKLFVEVIISCFNSIVLSHNAASSLPIHKHDYHRQWYLRGCLPLFWVQSVPQADCQDDRQCGAAPTEAARKEHLQLGGYGKSESHGSTRAVFISAHLQEHIGLHPLWRRSREQDGSQELAQPSGWKEHQTQWIYWCSESKTKITVHNSAYFSTSVSSH